MKQLIDSGNSAELNLSIWQKVDKSDPSQLKKVNQRGGYLSIDAYPQIKKATEMFGPMGIGFGLKDISYSIVTGDISNRDNPDKRGEILILESTFWYRYPDSNIMGYIPMFNQGEFGTSFSNDETFKKLITNSISKALSYLGFNYDVFCGSWDDDKYVNRPDIPAPAYLLENYKRLINCGLFNKSQISKVNKFQVDAGWTIVSVSNSIKACIEKIQKSDIEVPTLLEEGESIGVQESSVQDVNETEKEEEKKGANQT